MLLLARPARPGKIDVVVSGSLALAYLIIDDDVIEHHS